MKYRYALKYRNIIDSTIITMGNELGKKVECGYIDNYNNCPNCKKEFKTYRNEIQVIGSVSIFENGDRAIAYCLCKECSKSTSNIKYRELETFLVDKVNEL